MPLADLARLAQEKPLRVLLINAGEPDSLTWSGLYQPLRLAAKLLGPERLHVDVRSPDKFSADALRHWHLVLLVADESEAALKPASSRRVIERAREVFARFPYRIKDAIWRVVRPAAARVPSAASFASAASTSPSASSTCAMATRQR